MAAVRGVGPRQEPARRGADPGRVACLLGGGLLAALGLRRGGTAGAVLTLAGGALALRGAAGLAPTGLPLPALPAASDVLGRVERSLPPGATVKIRRSVTIGRPREEVWRFVRDLENFPRFARHVESVTVSGGGRSRWVVRGPGGARLAWDSQVEAEVEGERIAWSSLPGGDVRNAGVLGLRDAPGGRGTEVHLRLAYDAPGGRVGQALARLFGEEPGLQARDDLGRLKQLLETGETATNATRRAGPGGEGA